MACAARGGGWGGGGGGAGGGRLMMTHPRLQGPKVGGKSRGGEQRGMLWLVLMLRRTLPLYNGIHTHCQFLVLISKRFPCVPSAVGACCLPTIHSPSCSPPYPSKRPSQIIFRTIVQFYHGPQRYACTCTCMYMSRPSSSAAEAAAEASAPACCSTQPQASVEPRKNSIPDDLV